MQTKSAAILTLKRPGGYSLKGRKEIAHWLRKQARNRLRYGKAYDVDADFRSRYLY